VLGRLLNRSGGASVEELVDVDACFEQIQSLSQQNRESPDVEVEREILRQRQLAGIGLQQRARKRRNLIKPDYGSLSTDADLPEITPDQLSARLIRAALLRHGAVLVRGLVDREAALSLAEEVNRAYSERDRYAEKLQPEPGYYEELQPEPPNEPIPHRVAVKLGAGLLAADSPRVAFEMFEAFGRAGLRDIVQDYLGEPPAIAANKTTLRKVDPDIPGAWHQDGKFLGDVNSLNLWLSLSRCGDVAPGLDLVPRRLDDIVEAGIGDDGFETIVVTQEKAEELAGQAGIVRPIFEPGDAIFFDHLYLHQTASDPSMPNPRFAIENWFFGPSAFPEDYLALAV
jgi:Taurine catabolism dioxygenase TauD, TfdA family